MRELGLVLGGIAVFTVFFVGVIYPNVEYKGYASNHSCTGECYEQYVADNGTVGEQIQEQKAIAIAKEEAGIVDVFENIRGLWAGCAACHGAQGQGQGMFPKLAGQSSDYIAGRLNAYKNREKIGMNSTMMWGQAAGLSDKQIEQLSLFVEEGFPDE
jgi:cytochrome c553